MAAFEFGRTAGLTDRTGARSGIMGMVGLSTTLARFCAQKSELEVAERWYANSALEDLLGIPWR